MTRLILIATAIFALLNCAPPPKFRDAMAPSESPIEYIIEHKTPKDTAYTIAKEWVAKTFNSSKDIVQMEDKESGTIILKPLYKWSFPVNPMKTQFWDGYQRYTCTIKLKDGKAKISFEPGVAESLESGFNGRYFPVENMPEMRAYFEGLKKGLAVALSTQPAADNF